MILFITMKCFVTGKSFLETLILASANPQYDKWLFIEFPEKYKFRTCFVQIIFVVLSFKTIFIQNIFWTFWGIQWTISCKLWLTDSRMRASDTDLPLHIPKSSDIIQILYYWIVSRDGKTFAVYDMSVYRGWFHPCIFLFSFFRIKTIFSLPKMKMTSAYPKMIMQVCTYLLKRCSSKY